MSKMKTIRIAVAVGGDGMWSAVGWPTKHADEVADAAVYGLLEDVRYHMVWVTAEVPLPESVEVDATKVEVDSKTKP